MMSQKHAGKQGVDAKDKQQLGCSRDDEDGSSRISEVGLAPPCGAGDGVLRAFCCCSEFHRHERWGVEIVLEKQAEESSSKEASNRKCLAKSRVRKKQASNRICLPKELKSHLCVGIISVPRASCSTILGEPKPKRSKTVDDIVTTLETLVQQQHPKSANYTPLQVQAVIVAADVQPKTLIAHLGVLCASRGVEMFPISGG